MSSFRIVHTNAVPILSGTWHDGSWNPSRDPPRTMTIQFTGTLLMFMSLQSHVRTQSVIRNCYSSFHHWRKINTHRCSIHSRRRSGWTIYFKFPWQRPLCLQCCGIIQKWHTRRGSYTTNADNWPSRGTYSFRLRDLYVSNHSCTTIC